MSPVFPSVFRFRLTAAAIFGAALLAAPTLPAHAQSSSMAAHEAKASEHEQTVDQRIASLHDELKITQSEEADWQAVAQTMRDNAAAMEKLAASKATQSQQGMTAVEDLQTYAQFAQAHVEHLQKLTSAFTTLYEAMPAAQKKIADQVFEQSHREQSGGQG
jgi:glutamine synthetase adenylyltransferase